MILTPADGSHGSGPRGAATEPHGARPVRFDAPADAPSAAEIPYARLEDHPRLHRIAQGDVLRWMIRPERGSAADRTFAATHAAVDLELSDGTRLSDRDPLDQYGMRATARGQGEGRHLQLDQWNDVQVDLSHLEGLTIVGVLLVTDPPVTGGADADGGPEGERLRGWIEPPRVGPALALPHLDDPVAWVDTRRGAAGAPGLSRGSTAPVAALPNGFAHVLPLTDARDRATPYRHARAQAAEGGALPPLQGIALAHQPGARPDSGQQFTLMPLVTRRPHGGPRERALGFDHAQEVARPDVYSVRTAQGTALHAAPTEHGMLLEIVFAPGSEGRHLLLEGADSRSRFDLAGALFDGAFTAWADGEAPHPGGGPARRLFAAGTVEPLPSHVEDAVSDGDPGLLGTARVMTFPPGTRRVTVRIAASAIGLEQARRTLAQQLLGRTFAEVRRAAHAAWVPRLEVIRSDSASPAQRRTLLGSLYRMNLHPRALHENAGTRQRPLLQHASVRAVPRAEATSSRTAAPLLPGPAYADLSAPGSASTLWPAYSLLYPALAGPMLEAIPAQAPNPEPATEEAEAPAEVAGVLAAEGALGALAALADAHARGVPLADPLGAAGRAVERLTAVPAAEGRGEEEPVVCAALRGWTDARVPGSVGLDLARSVADDAIAQMVERALAALPKDALGADSRALAEQAAYLRSRAARYALHFDADLGLLRARTRDGGFAEDLEDVNPFAWTAEHLRANGWIGSLAVPHDGTGLAELLGGPEALLERLEQLVHMDDPWAGSTGPAPADDAAAPAPAELLSPAHVRESARASRLGQFSLASAAARALPALFHHADAPDRAQQIVHDLGSRLFTGEEIGQGLPGDDADGALSAWWLLSALGLLPLQLGSDRWHLVTGLLGTVRVSPIGGAPFTISHQRPVRADGEHPGGAEDALLIQSVRRADESEELDVRALRHEDLRGDLVIELGAEPGPVGAPIPALTPAGASPQPLRDLLGHLPPEDPRALLFDDEARQDIPFEPAADGRIVIDLPETGGPASPRFLTLVTAQSEGVAPDGWQLEAWVEADDGAGAWRRVDAREGLRLRGRCRLHAFVLPPLPGMDGSSAPGASEWESPAGPTRYRLILISPWHAVALRQIELLG